MISLWFLRFVFILCVMVVADVFAVGVNWGTMATHNLPPKTVVQMLKDNGFEKVKLFDTNPTTMSALAGSNVEVMVAIPNDQLTAMTDYTRAMAWVKKNVSRYHFNGGVNIKYVAVGNEPFLETYNGSLIRVTLPALQNIQKALGEAGLDFIKATVPLNADVYDSPADRPYPSAGRFRSDISDVMTQITQFLSLNDAPFTVNIYPFLSLYGNDDFPVDYAFFDGTSQPVLDPVTGIQYANVFQANFDTLISSLEAVGCGNMTVMVGEVGWPTDGDKNANVATAYRFYYGLLSLLAHDAVSPRRPGHIDAYLFGLVDEDAKSVAPGNFERHWGLFRYDGQPKFPLDLSGQRQSQLLAGARDVVYQPRKWCKFNSDAKNLSRLPDNINYACSFSDCTPLGYGSSCNLLDTSGNASFAFNMYYQVQQQDDLACNFEGLAVVTSENISQLDCNFTIQIVSSSSSPAFSPAIFGILAISPALSFLLLF